MNEILLAPYSLNFIWAIIWTAAAIHLYYMNV